MVEKYLKIIEFLRLVSRVKKSFCEDCDNFPSMCAWASSPSNKENYMGGLYWNVRIKEQKWCYRIVSEHVYKMKRKLDIIDGTIVIT